MGKVNTFLGAEYDFSPSQGISIKVMGKEGESTPGGCNNILTFLLRMEYLAYDSGRYSCWTLFCI